MIAGHAHLEGTIRGLTQEMILKIDQRLKDVCEGIAKSFNVKVDLQLNQGGYWPVENNPELTKRFIEYMKQAAGVEFIETAPAMTGEDFGWELKMTHSCIRRP